MPNQNKGTFPSDTQKNPKDCRAIQLRSGKDLSSNRKTDRNKETEAEKEETEKKEEKNNLIEQMKGKNDQKKKGVPAYAPAVPFPQRLQKSKREEQFSKFLDLFKKIEINIPFEDVISQMPLYAKFLKEVLSKKRKIAEEGIVNLNASCSAIIQLPNPINTQLLLKESSSWRLRKRSLGSRRLVYFNFLFLFLCFAVIFRLY